MAKILDEWGENNVWNEIQLLLANCKGKVLDIACGTGKTIEILKKFNEIEVYGCDISELLIQKGINRGIPNEFLKVCDATKTNYLDNEFDYSYSIRIIGTFYFNRNRGLYKRKLSNNIKSKFSYDSYF